ncbi:MAG: pyridoxamine 5'-phosphate oxidase family protein [Chloroflexota bacterium]|nr:pyridoxamine 5'-phosphate oxidase family protein [Dehalococcoidia bacterium]MDW8253012.1 pyridoxamine 5'-phosphate oxidase family protein [Chloroflexota bacterium]
MADRPPLDAETKARVRDEAIALIGSRRIGILVTYPPGEPFPRLRAMGFVHDGWVFYVSTRRGWRKAAEVAANPHVSLLFSDTAKRADHFIQVDCRAIEVSGGEFDRWQEKRYQKEGEALRRATAGMTRDDWVGWRLEPLRVRINGHISSGPWSEAPVVLSRHELGLPPLGRPLTGPAGSDGERSG